MHMFMMYNNDDLGSKSILPQADVRVLRIFRVYSCLYRVKSKKLQEASAMLVFGFGPVGSVIVGSYYGKPDKFLGCGRGVFE